MIDQATELRKLVLRAMREGQSTHGPPPRLVLMTSGRQGTGVTTLAVNVSVALAEQGLRVVLVDASAARGGVADLCGLSDRSTGSDLLGTRRDIHEVLQLGPAGIQIVPGLRAGPQEPEIGALGLERLVRQFMQLGRHADSVVLDLGNGPHEWLRRLAQVADDIILVTTPDDGSLKDAYTRIKLTIASTSSAALWLVVNLADHAQAGDVYQRLRQSCERFLGHGVCLLGWMASDAAVPEAVARAVPFVLGRPSSAASRAVQRMASDLAMRDTGSERPRAAA